MCFSSDCEFDSAHHVSAICHVHKPAFACLTYNLRIQLQMYLNSLTMLAGANRHTESH